MTNAPPTNQSIENLLTVLDVVREHAPPGVAEWFAGGVEACMNDQGSIDKCLGISACKQGSRHGARMYNAQQRNIHLVAAHRVCSDDVRTWQRSIVLANQVEDFYVIWPIFMDKESPDKAWSQLKTALFMAFKFGSKYEGGLPPKSYNRLHEIYCKHERK